MSPILPVSDASRANAVQSGPSSTAPGSSGWRTDRYSTSRTYSHTSFTIYSSNSAASRWSAGELNRSGSPGSRKSKEPSERKMAKLTVRGKLDDYVSEMQKILRVLQNTDPDALQGKLQEPPAKD